MTIVDLTIVNVALPTIGRKLHFSESNLQWVVTAYGLTFGGFLLLGGRAADLLGRRRIMMSGLALFTGASLGCGPRDERRVPDRDAWGARTRRGDRAARSTLDRDERVLRGAERNKALGLWGAVGATGATFGVIAGGVLARYVGWEYIFFLNVPIGAAALALARRIVPESRLEITTRRYDPLGALTVTGGLLLLVYTISHAPDVGWETARTSRCWSRPRRSLRSSWSRRGWRRPLLPLALFRCARAAANAVSFLLGGASSPSSSSARSTCSRCSVLGPAAGLAWLATSLTSVALAGRRRTRDPISPGRDGESG